jgi:hypothetical protein
MGADDGIASGYIMKDLIEVSEAQLRLDQRIDQIFKQMDIDRDAKITLVSSHLYLNIARIPECRNSRPIVVGDIRFHQEGHFEADQRRRIRA